MIVPIVSFIVISTLLMVALLANNITKYELNKIQTEEQTNKISQKVLSEAKKSKISKDKQQ